jgi:hypothetical protein
VDEKRTINYRGVLLMFVAFQLTIVIFLNNPGSWQMWSMLGMVGVGFCHFIGALYCQGKWIEKQSEKKKEFENH